MGTSLCGRWKCVNIGTFQISKLAQQALYRRYRSFCQVHHVLDAIELVSVSFNPLWVKCPKGILLTVPQHIRQDTHLNILDLLLGTYWTPTELCLLIQGIIDLGDLGDS